MAGYGWGSSAIMGRGLSSSAAWFLGGSSLSVIYHSSTHLVVKFEPLF